MAEIPGTEQEVRPDVLELGPQTVISSDIPHAADHFYRGTIPEGCFVTIVFPTALQNEVAGNKRYEAQWRTEQGKRKPKFREKFYNVRVDSLWQMVDGKKEQSAFVEVDFEWVLYPGSQFYISHAQLESAVARQDAPETRPVDTSERDDEKPATDHGSSDSADVAPPPPDTYQQGVLMPFDD